MTNSLSHDTAAEAIPRLVSAVYAAAPPAEQRVLLQHLLAPLGVLSLVAIAGGVFAKLRFRADWQNFQVRLDDVTDVRADDVVALVDHVQQVSVESVDALAQVLTASPVLAGSAAAALLVSLLVQRARRRSGGRPAPL